MPSKKWKDYPACLNTSCNDRGWHSRGLCRNCYNAAAHLVKADEVTWDELEEAGKVHPAKGPGRPRTTSKFFLDE